MPVDQTRKKAIRALKAAFPHTIPVLTGYAFLGFAYGFLMNSKGYGVGWAVLFSLIVFAGSAQYTAITFLTAVFDPLAAFILSLMINARHLFYGVSMLTKYKETGRLKPYLIFGLTDETFSIISTTSVPDGVDQKWFWFFITALDHGYWVLGTALGGLIGYLISFNTKGLDFVLTALFVTIFLGQWDRSSQRLPAAIGVICSIVCLLIFGQSNFIIPAMAAILLILTGLQKKLVVEELQ